MDPWDRRRLASPARLRSRTPTAHDGVAISKLERQGAGRIARDLLAEGHTRQGTDTKLNHPQRTAHLPSSGDFGPLILPAFFIGPIADALVANLS
jgi:hypothetical protein